MEGMAPPHSYLLIPKIGGQGRNYRPSVGQFLTREQTNYIYLVEVWYSLEQYIGLKEDKLSSTTVDFIRSEGNLETKRLYWFSKPKMC